MAQPVTDTTLAVQVTDATTGDPVSGGTFAFGECPGFGGPSYNCKNNSVPCGASEGYCTCYAGSTAIPKNGYVIRTYNHCTQNCTTVGPKTVCNDTCPIQQPFTITVPGYSTYSDTWHGLCDGSLTVIAAKLVPNTNSGCTESSQCGSGQCCISGVCQACASGCTCNTDCSASSVGPCCIGGACAQCQTSGYCACDGDCPSGQTCNNGLCTPVGGTCSCNTDCPSGQTCVNGVCSTSSQQCGTDGDDNGCSADCNTICGSVGGTCNDGTCTCNSGGCTSDTQCPTGQCCVNGNCQTCSTGVNWILWISLGLIVGISIVTILLVLHWTGKKIQTP